MQALLEAWNNPYARAQLSLPAPLKANSYDQALAKFLVQKLNIDPGQLVTVSSAVPKAVPLSKAVLSTSK